MGFQANPGFFVDDPGTPLDESSLNFQSAAEPPATPQNSNPLYMRKWQLLVLGEDETDEVFDSLKGTSSASGEGSSPAVDLSGLRCMFRIEKNFANHMQFGEVIIYNLNPETESAIMMLGSQVVLKAGYENGSFGVIFRGYIFQALRGKEDGVTYFLKLVCIDGDDALNMGFCSFAIASGQPQRVIAAQIARSSTVPFRALHVDENLGDHKLQRGKVVFGQPRDYLRNIALNDNASFYMDNGEAHIAKVEREPTSDIVVKINSETGMIGMPQQTEYGIEVRTLLNPQIKINNFIELNNRDVQPMQLSFGASPVLLDLDGLYRVIKIIATGDTRGNDWYYDIETVSQEGMLPVMLSDKYASGF
jgi:hypothetical protein